MAKVYGVHQIELREGVTPEQFEEFVVEEMYALPKFEGVDWCLLKGDKGDRVGKYGLMFECESVEARDQVSLSALKPDDRAAWEKLLNMADLIFTDYVVVGK